MYSCAIELDGFRIVFKSSRDLVPAFLRLAGTPAFLGLGVLPAVSEGRYRIRYQETGPPLVRYSRRGAEITGSWSAVREGETLLYAALPFIELQNQQSGFVTAHAAAVALADGATLILGKEGSGKTTTAIGLCRWRGGRLIGNDLVSVGIVRESGQITVRSGTKFLSFRYESIRRSMPDLLHLFPPRDEDPWLRKALLHPSEASVSIHEGALPLVGAFLVHVDETKDTLTAKSADSAVTRLYLNENFSRYIRGSCIALLGEHLEYLGYVPSFDSDSLFARRKALMERLLGEHSMQYVSGPVGKVVDHIASRCGGRGS